MRKILTSTACMRMKRKIAALARVLATGEIKRKTVSGLLLTLLLIGMLTLAFDTQQVRSLGPPTTEWSRTYGGTAGERAHSVIQANDGGYAIAGYTESFGAGNDDFWLVKTDSAGNMEWNETYGGSDTDGVHSVVQTSDGGYAMAGWTYSFGAGNNDFWLVKTNSTGHMEWNKTYGGLYSEGAESVVQTSDGGYAIAGYTYSFGAGDNDFWLVKTDSAGSEQWSRTYGGDRFEHLTSMIQTSDGGYAMAGSTRSYTGSDTSWLVKTDLDGNMEWDRTYGSSLFYSLVQTVDGGYAMAGRTWTGSDWNFWLVKTNSTGHGQWSRAYGGAGNDIPYSVVQTVNGGYAMAGDTTSYGAGDYDFWLVKTNYAGNMQWNRAYGGVNFDRAYAMIQTVDEGYALAGVTESFGAGYEDFWLIKLGPVVGVHDLAVTNAVSSRPWVLPGDSVSIDLTVENQGNYIETFNMTTYANDTQIDKQTVTNLNAGENKILSFTWNTTGFAIGNYTISANATIVPEEIDTADNTYIDGIVEVRVPTHDVAVVNVTPASNIIPEGFDLNISVTVENLGTFMEAFNVTAYANTTAIGEQEVILNYEESAILVFAWDTTGFSFGNYTISAYATPVAEETSTDDNTFVNGVVTVRQSVHDVAVMDVTPSKTVVGQGYIVSISVTVENQGDFVETFDVTTYANTTEIQTKTATNLNSLGNLVLTFEWDTAEIPLGNYTIRAVADSVPEEFDTIDNTFADGTVTIQLPTHDVAVTSVTLSDIFTGAGSSIEITVEVENRGNMRETFNATVFANEVEIQVKTVTNMDYGATQILGFTWHTTGFPLGSYTMTATASIVAGETRTEDNIFVGGMVSIVEGTLVYVCPQVTWVQPNQTFTIDTCVCNVIDLYVWEVTLYFNSTVLTWVSGGSLLDSSVMAMGWISSPGTGSYDLLQITFKGKTEGISSLHLSVILLDSSYQDIASNTADGEVKVGQHEIVATDVTPYKTTVGQGHPIRISATIENNGSFVETFGVVICANTTIINTLTNITLATSNSTTVTSMWDTTDWAKGNYTLGAYAWPDGIGLASDGWVFVTIAGDVDADRDVDIYDIVRMSGVYGVALPDPRYDPNSDWNNDGIINIYDIVIAAGNYGDSW